MVDINVPISNEPTVRSKVVAMAIWMVLESLKAGFGLQYVELSL